MISGVGGPFAMGTLSRAGLTAKFNAIDQFLFYSTWNLCLHVALVQTNYTKYGVLNSTEFSACQALPPVRTASIPYLV
jgi:hypothetical protein